MKVLFHRTKHTVWRWGKGVSELEDKTGRPAESVKPSLLPTETDCMQHCVFLLCQLKKHFALDF